MNTGIIGEHIVLIARVVIEHMLLHYIIEDKDNLVADEVSILNCCRDYIFIQLCLSIILSNNPPIGSKIVLS